MKIFTTLILLFFSLSAFSQSITTVPVFPTENDSIVITFNVAEMTRGKNELLDYSGTLYTHTGVYVNGDESTWKYVIGSWGDNISQPVLTRIGDNLYQLIISNPREFYKINNTDHITKLNFVLRSEDATKQSEDLHVALFYDGLNVMINNPALSPQIVKSGDQLNVNVTSNLSDTIKLFFNNQLLTLTTLNELNYQFTINGKGKNWLVAKAINSSSAVSDSIQIFIRKDPAIAEAPIGTKDGINYINDNTVTLKLFAPNKEYVFVLGDFNNWEIDSNMQMNRTPNDSTYWLTITNLMPQKEYRFQYLVDGNIKIADPYADKILEKEDDKIPAETYPDLIPYPYSQTDYSVSVLQTGQVSFNWNSSNYTKPQKEKLIIYELLIRDFVSTHDYKTLIDTLNYLENLGINAIELMPINEFEGNESWGYNPSFYFAPDKYYGPKNDLKKFIDECHKRNIAVILDIVLNHTYGRSPFVRLYSSGIFGPPTNENPWYNITSPNPVFSWGFDLNHESKFTQKLVDRINRYWIDEYNIDGYRFDFTKGFTNTPGDGGGFDQARINILKRMADSLWTFDSTAYIILEHFAPDSEEQILTDYGMMVWGNNNYNYNEATMGFNTDGKSNFDRISYKNHGFSKPHLVGYMESHDEERLMYKNLQYGNSSGSYNIKELNTALNRIKLAAAFFITVPGPKMLWQFEELGYDFSIDYNGRIGNKPIRWDYFDNVNRKNLYKTISALNFLKNKYPAFSTDDFVVAVSSSNKLIKLNHPTMDVLIIGNFGVESSVVIPNFQYTGIWYDYFSGDTVEVTNLQSQLELKAGEFHIYTTVKLPTPEKDILLSLNNKYDTAPEKFSLYQNFPNPFNPTTTIKYTIPNAVGTKHALFLQSVHLKIYDLLGQEVATLIDKKQLPGNYEIKFDASNLSSGVYLYSLTAGSHFKTKKMVVLK